MFAWPGGHDSKKESFLFPLKNEKVIKLVYYTKHVKAKIIRLKLLYHIRFQVPNFVLTVLMSQQSRQSLQVVLKMVLVTTTVNILTTLPLKMQRCVRSGARTTKGVSSSHTTSPIMNVI